MASLYDSIKATGGLLAYWPLRTDATDHSGNNRHLTQDGAVVYTEPPLTTDAMPSVRTLNNASALRIAQDSLPKIRAIEGIFRLAGAKLGVWSAAIGLNQPLTGSNGRYILLYHETTQFCSYWSPGSTPTYYQSVVNSWDNMSVGAHHYVIQLNAAGTATEVYIDGVKDNGMTVPTDVFLQAANTHLAVAAYYYNGNTNGNCNTSDVAIYDRPLTPAEIASRQPYRLSDDYELKRIFQTAGPANQEPRSQFEPQDMAWRGSPGSVYAGPMPAVAVTTDPLCQGQDLTWVRDGTQNVLQGYIESTVTIDGEGVRRRVLCLDQAGNLIGETYSRASDGKYRFDLLWLNRRYMLVAQDDPAFGPADYNAVAADYQLPTPYAPGEGVGLV
ncbi:LamG-like jellyroll fold domain-containing protein [Aeromonas caviae]|uniref:LamG-like jellyroll fold domain-containing protein n=1 Tax=Aeromonas caviae TaxID=648 RepID=UPI002B481AA0|nr:LamG-like jellyroll fold domain-containing protein [Aeromonas caviae]